MMMMMIMISCLKFPNKYRSHRKCLKLPSQLHCRLTPTHQGTPEYICIYLIFLETRIIGLHFATDSVGLSSFKFFWWAPLYDFFLQRVRFGHSRSSKVIDVGTNWKRVYDFLLVCHSYLGPVLHHFRDIAGFVLITPPYSTLILEVFPLDQIADGGVSPSMYLKLISREIIFEVFQLM